MHLLIENPRFRLFWIAGVFGDVSLIAYWTIHGWLALEVSGSPFWVGATAGVGGVAMFLFAPIGGAMIDRFPKKDLLRIATLLRGLLAVGLTALIFSDTIQLWQVIGYAFLSGMAASRPRAGHEDAGDGHCRTREPARRLRAPHGVHDRRGRRPFRSP